MNSVAQEILADLRETRPDLDPSWVVAQPVDSYDDAPHAGYAAGRQCGRDPLPQCHRRAQALQAYDNDKLFTLKHDALMADMGMPGFSQPVNPFDCDLLIKRFVELESNSEQFREVLMRSNAANEELLREQFAELSSVLFPEDRADA